MKTAVIYARYSSERQTEQSIEGQLRVCRDYAARNELLIVDTYIDRAMTGTNDQRDAFQKMMKDSAKKAWDYVLVYKFDRFSRNKYECTIHKHTLKENGIKLLSAMENIPDSPEGVILESLLEGMNQYYSMELAQKVRRGMNESRLKGQYTGGSVLFGYRVVNKKVIINEDEAAIMRKAFEDYATGTHGTEIIARMAEQGILLHGHPFPKNTFYAMLANEKYIGICRHEGQEFTNIYPAIISKNLFAAVQKRLQENHGGKHPKNIRYLLRDKIKCGYCGQPISSETGTSLNGTVMRYYKCYGRKALKNGCKKNTVQKDELEKLVVDITLQVLSDDNTLSDITDRIMELNKKKSEDESVTNFLRQEQEKIQKALLNLVAAVEQGIISSTTKQRLDELESQLSDIKAKLAVEESKEQIALTRSDIMRYLKMAIKKEPLPMIRLLIREIILYDDKIEIYYNYSDNPDDGNRRDFSFYSGKYEYTTTAQHYCLDRNVKEFSTQKSIDVELKMTV